MSEPFFFVNLRDHKIQTWYILGSFFYRSFKIDASCTLQITNKTMVSLLATGASAAVNALAFSGTNYLFSKFSNHGEAVRSDPEMLKLVPDQYKTQEMCNKAVRSQPEMLEFVPDQFVTQEMCNEAVRSDPWMLKHVPDQYKTQEMCNEAVEKRPRMLKLVPDQYKTREMCNEAVQRVPWMFEYVPDWFVTQEMRHQDFDDDVLITLRDAYIKRKIQKTKIKEELMPFAWHADRWWNWCVPEDEKKELEKYFT